MAYTEPERRELMDRLANNLMECDPEFAESLVVGIIEKQKAEGLIGPQRPLPTRLAKAWAEGEQDGAN